MAFFEKRVESGIRKLLESLNEDNYDAVVDKLSEYIEYGAEESILLVQTCLDHFKIYEEELKSTNLEPVVATLFRKLLEKPHFSSVFTGFVRRTSINEEFLDNLSSALKLSAYEKLGFGLALTDSERNDVRTAGRNFCMAQFEELRATRVHIRLLKQSEGFSEHVGSFMQRKLRVWLNENSGFILAPLHSDQLHDSELRKLVFPSSPEIPRSLPMAAVCDNVWKNTEEQFPFIKHALTLSPETSMFAHFRRELAYEDPEDDHKFHADHANNPWLSIDHLERLCLLAENGHETFVRSMLEFPLKHCPEVLLIGMAHVITPCNLLQREVSSVVLPRLLKDDSKSEVVLNLWNVNPVFFSRALKDALNSDDLESTNTVVNLLEDLQILSSVLDLVPMSLGIRLAALASVKEFIDLEEWLSTNLSIYEDSFFEECLSFLKVVEADARDSSDGGEILSAYEETIPIFLKVLQLHTSLLCDQLSEAVESLYETPMDNSQTTKNVGDPSSSTSEICAAEDIEKEVDFYFQEMFSGQLTVDAMVQKLTQFKGSSEKREQSVFECMINNLFEVYKFIDKYPDEQLKIVAVLFGLLIKHRLMSHTILGISLQAVLDALHEPEDSKMFVFGTKALESFVDCLIEWPEYSQEILQISHLRLTHSGLVSVIEQTLACTPSSQPESDEGHDSGTNQHHSSNPPENVEMPASSLPLTGADGGAQIDSQVCSPVQQHQTNESHMDEIQKASLTSSSDTNPNLSNSRQVSATSSDSVSIQKPQNVVKPSVETSSSLGFSSPSRAVTSARFGSASSIGTLLAAAEKRGTPIEVLQLQTSLLCNQLFEEVKSLYETPMDNSQTTKNVGDPNSSTSEMHAVEDIETEVGLYFQEMFSGQLTVDAMVQKLTHFKESSEKREQSVFECMINKLFEVYKFIDKYPDEQLTIVGVLFGLLIKHRLVSHTILGISLQAVLDALHEPEDSKMFVFGTKALESFVDCLIEWPEYSQEILQISHLRLTHSGLISVIEQTLACTSSSHPESDEGHDSGTNQQHSSNPPENVEIPASSLPLTGADGAQMDSQVRSPIQVHQTNESHMDETQKASLTSSTDTNPESDEGRNSDTNQPHSSNPPENVEMPASSLPLTGDDDGAQIDSQVCSPIQLHQTNESHMDEIQKASVTSSSDTDPNLSNSRQVSVTSSDSVSIQKQPQNVVKPSAETSSSPGFSSPSRTVISARFGSASSIGTLLAAAERRETPIKAPPSETQDRIFFIINNLSSTNIEVKAQEFTEILEEQYYPWFGHYIVMKRASIEPNFHMLYLNLLEKVNSTRLNEEVVRATYENCKVLLRSELIKSSVEERSLLKNLGGWLGKITIGRNRVLRSRDIDPKSLLLEAYEKGLMIGVIPFISKILEPCRSSLAYQPPNPWTMAILGLLAEIHSMPNLKVNLKFEIEVLMKNLDLDLKAVTPTSLLEGRVRKFEENPDFSTKDVPSSQQHIVEEANSTVRSDVTQVKLLPEAADPSYQLPAPTLNLPQQANANPEPQPSDLDMQFQRVLPLAMDNAIKEIVSSIVQTSASIASHTTVELILKEYDNDTESNEDCILEASCMMVVLLAGNLAYVTCKEPLRRSISTQLRNLLQGSDIGSEFLEQSIQRAIHENLDLGCASIEKAATDKGITMVRSELAQKLPLRRKQREGDRPATVDPDLPTQSDVVALPEAFYPRSVRISHPQQQVYEGFVPLRAPNFSQPPTIFVAVPLVPQFFTTSSIHTMMASNGHPCNNENEGVVLPSFPPPQSHVLLEPLNVDKELGISKQPLLPSSDSESFTRNTVEPPLTTDAVLNIYQFLSKKLEYLIATGAKEAEIQLVIAEIPTVILRCISKEEAALAVAQKVFECLYENANNNAHVDAHLATLSAICDVSKPVGKELTSWVLLSDDDRKFHLYITVGLIRRELLNLAEYNVHMAKLIDAGKKGVATEFCISLIQTLQASDAARVISELHNVIDALAKVTNPAAGMDDNSAADFHGQVFMLLIEWRQICDLPGVDDAPRAHYVLQLNRNVLSKADDMPDRFFRVLLEIAVSHYLVSEGINLSQPRMSQQEHRSSFLVIDLYADLVFSILEYCPVDQGPNKLSLLSKVLEVIVKFIKKDVEEKKASFYPNPYVRLFKNFLLHVNSLDSVIKDADFQVLTALSNSYHALQPMKVPAFSFAWLELVSDRYFMPIMLTTNDQKGWPYFERLMIDLLQFLEPLLRTGEIAEPVRVFYEGTLRVLLVLLHDFPEFLSCYYFSFCDVISPHCIQLRNIILSAFPKMRIPDPNTPNLKVDLLVEMSQTPSILSEFDGVLQANKLKRRVDEYLLIRPDESSFFSELKYKLHLSSREAERRGTNYNVPLMNSLVLYIGTQAIEQIQASTASYATCIARCMELSVLFAGAALDIFRTLILELDSEGRYVFFNAVANQLRYPNNHTHYFSFVMLYFFTELNQEPIQEVITRVLLERLMTKRPHPWGALVTFLELIKNEKYNFWNLSFTKCAPEIEKVFKSVSISCGLRKPEDDPSGSGAP